MSGTYPNINDEVAPSSVTWGLDHNVLMFESFSNISQALTIPAARWRGSMSFDPDVVEADDLQLFLEQLGGRAGRFCVRDPRAKTYPAQGTPTVNGPNQTGGLLTTQGWLPSRLIMRKGQYFNVGLELKRSKQDIYSDINGAASLRFYPNIRIAPANATAINTADPFMLATLDNNYNPLETDADLNSSIQIAFTEAIYERS